MDSGEHQHDGPEGDSPLTDELIGELEETAPGSTAHDAKPLPEPLVAEEIRDRIRNHPDSDHESDIPNTPTQEHEQGMRSSVPYEGVAHIYKSRNGKKLRTIKVMHLGAESITQFGGQNQSGHIELPEQQATNALAYFQARIGQPSADRYNCHAFGYAVAGWPDAQPPKTRLQGLQNALSTGKLHMRYDPEQLDEVSDPGHLQPGAVYGVGKSDGRIAHTFVGLREGSISVLGIGKNRPLVVADAADLANFYGGNIYRIKSPSTYASSVYRPHTT